ncbi:MAG: CBS domain-containing protein [Nitrospinae bacterium]|nr:CBS domain-containing protein [Nitrospinota bacterium]
MTDYQSVRDIMMPNFKKIEGITKVSDALAIMTQNKINAILIEPRNEADVYGIMTRRDIARKVIGERRKLHETHVYEIMTKPVLNVPPNMPLTYAARHLTNFKVSYAMVLENNTVIGMISLNGIVQHWDQG